MGIYPIPPREVNEFIIKFRRFIKENIVSNQKVHIVGYFNINLGVNSREDTSSEP